VITQLLLTEKEAVEALRISARKLRQARDAGTLRYVLIGRAVRYTPDDLKQFVDSLRQVKPPCPQEVHKRTGTGTRRSGKVIPFHRRNAPSARNDGL
jgi:Helix-turn-helix domain